MDGISESVGGLPESLTYNKHIPQAPAKCSRRTTRHLIRATAKRCAEDPDVLSRYDSSALPYFIVADPKAVSHDGLRPQIELDLHYGHRDTQEWRALRKGMRRQMTRQAASRSGGVRWGVSDEAEGRDLARSRISLPTDASRIRRRSLEREEAFCDATTYKGRGTVLVRRPESQSDDAQVAELYDMGLLYDDEPSATEPFNLNSIQHEQPVYSIRPAKRARKANKTRGFGVEQPLDIDLSFADLGTDEAIAHYLMTPSSEEAGDNIGEDAIQHASRHPGYSFASLRVIYELASSRPSFDVETSQQPDLVDDILSDYDCFSDSELDDTPSQRELHDDGSDSSGGSDAAGHGRPTEPWVILG